MSWIGGGLLIALGVFTVCRLVRSWRIARSQARAAPIRLAPVRREARSLRGLTLVDRSDLLFVVLPFVALALFSIGFVVLFRHRWRMDRAAMRRAAAWWSPTSSRLHAIPRRRRRPWWANPWIWVGVSAGFVVLGVVVWRPLLRAACSCSSRSCGSRVRSRRPWIRDPTDTRSARARSSRPALGATSSTNPPISAAASRSRRHR